MGIDGKKDIRNKVGLINFYETNYCYRTGGRMDYLVKAESDAPGYVRWYKFSLVDF